MNAKALSVADTLCRACVKHLSIDNTGKAIQFVEISATPDLSSRLSACISKEFSTNVNCSKYLCMDCFQIVNEFFEFRAMCEEAIQRFEELQGQKEAAKPISNANEIIIKNEYAFDEPTVGSHANLNERQEAQLDKCQMSIGRFEPVEHDKDVRPFQNLNEVIKEEYDFIDTPMTSNSSNNAIELAKQNPATQGVEKVDLEQAVSLKNEPAFNEDDDIEFIMVVDSEDSQEELLETSAKVKANGKNLGEANNTAEKKQLSFCY